MVPTDPLRQLRQAATSGFPKAALETLLGASVRVYLQDIESPTPCPSPQPTSALPENKRSQLYIPEPTLALLPLEGLLNQLFKIIYKF